ncbi:SRPBCC domain-containing protein [Danxiaibacter flavus]|uniref:SRPBCC domain-containing protein n=1 Tax=Danxiaibacter flavus TaxID=3049108 RepID=A0ABV3ZDB1_9BACT|nr:SRPBCC domain-containing protein [Chitinophagaceae bacterium DXS]
MATQDFTVNFLVDKTPEEVFNAINNVRGWWIDEIEGNSEKLNDEFAVRFADIHYSKQKLIESVPSSKIVWLITDSQLNFLQDKQEWNGTKISFDITKKENQTEVRFTHIGLAPKIQCYTDCSNAWQDYISNSLYSFITTGKGQPYKVKAAVESN